LKAAVRTIGEGLGLGEATGVGLKLALGLAEGETAARLPAGMKPATLGTRNTMPATRASTAPTVAKAAVMRITAAGGKEPKTNAI
jgi:hypothetical protein